MSVLLWLLLPLLGPSVSLLPATSCLSPSLLVLLTVCKPLMKMTVCHSLAIKMPDRELEERLPVS